MTTMTRRTGTVRKVAHDPGDPLVTSHCPFCGSGQVVGRSDGTIGCDFCGQNYIVRVQPAFPGMPQMPMGPGAPSDVGPDSGLVDPGMIGPDGAPMDGGGPPPGEDAEPGDGPQDESPDDGGDFPPSGGDSEDGTGSKPPKKGDSGKSKKESALRGTAVRRYSGLEGQPLTEDQLVRHIAVRASGADPAVMRVLRATSGRRVTADDGAPVNYRTLGSGHQVVVGRHPSVGWYGMIRPPEPHSDMAHYMALGHADTREEAHQLAESHLRRGPARDFVRSTTTDLGGPASGYTSPGWHRGPGAGTSPSEWRPAQASRGRRPFARGAHQEPLRDLASLRAHMSGEHGLDVSGMLPLKVLLSLHGKDHAEHEDTWGGSADSSRAPGFVAARGTGTLMRAAAEDWGGQWDRAMDSLAGSGFPDSQMHLDTGHRMWVYRKGEGAKSGGLFGESTRPGFHAQVWHPAGDQGHVVEAHLGEVPEHVGPLLRGMFGRRDVLGHLRDQMDRAQGHGPDQTGNRLMIDMTQR